MQADGTWFGCDPVARQAKCAQRNNLQTNRTNPAKYPATLDVFPTLCDLTGLPKPDSLDGTSLVPILEDPRAPGQPAVAYQRSTQTIRTDSHRLIAHQSGHLELYDHRTPEAETRNRAESDPATVKKLLEQLRQRLP